MNVLAASPRQIALVDDLLKQLHHDQAAEMHQELSRRGIFQSRVLTSEVIDNLIAQKRRMPRAHPVVENPAVEAGMYKVDDQIYKVQKAVHGSGILYAKKLVPPTAFGGKAEFVYAPGVIRTLTAANKLTLEEAKAFGVLYGTCVCCGRTLTDERSIAAGIGPVCAGRL